MTYRRTRKGGKFNRRTAKRGGFDVKKIQNSVTQSLTNLGNNVMKFGKKVTDKAASGFTDASNYVGSVAKKGKNVVENTGSALMADGRKGFDEAETAATNVKQTVASKIGGRKTRRTRRGGAGCPGLAHTEHTGGRKTRHSKTRHRKKKHYKKKH